jgi:hypothetical protein
LSLFQERKKEPSCHSTESNPCGTFIAIQMVQGVMVGSTGQLERAGRRDGTHCPPQLNRRAGGPSPHITAHRPSIELPQRAKTATLQMGMPPPKRCCKFINCHAMGFQTTTHGQAPQRE